MNEWILSFVQRYVELKEGAFKYTYWPVVLDLGPQRKEGRKAGSEEGGAGCN